LTGFFALPCVIPEIMALSPTLCPATGDPCDVIVANSPAILPGALMSCKVVGVLLMRDEAGFDEKIVAVPSARLIERGQKAENYTDLPEITRQQIEHFFCHYKDLDPGKRVKIERCGDAA
jgi:inorganic pyrophosphatase